jgi:hypothetical protein
VVTLEDTVLFIVVEEEPQPDEVLVIVDVGVFDLDTYESFGAEVPIVVRKGAECGCSPNTFANSLLSEVCLDDCPEPFPPLPEFSVITHPNGFEGINACEDSERDTRTLGVFMPVSARLVEPFAVNLCLDRASDSWRFSIPEITINTILDQCDFGSRRPIRTLTGARLIQDQCCALFDFTGHYSYPIRAFRQDAYVIVDAILAHEQEHKRDFDKVLTEAREAVFFDALVSGVHPSCTDYTEEQARELIRRFLDTMRENLIEAIKTKWNKRTGDLNTPERDAYEQDVQRRDAIKNIIEDYKKALRFTESECRTTHCQ